MNSYFFEKYSEDRQEQLRAEADAYRLIKSSKSSPHFANPAESEVTLSVVRLATTLLSRRAPSV